MVETETRSTRVKHGKKEKMKNIWGWVLAIGIAVAVAFVVLC